MLIGISGKKKSGKDTAAKIISEQLDNSVILHFADALKLEIAQATGFSLRYIDEHKDNFRLILQGWGTDFRRKIYGEDYWIKKLHEFIVEESEDNISLSDDCFNLIIADVRFQNEFDYIKSHGGIMIHMIRSVDYSDNHISETELDEVKHDYTIHNIGTEQHLAEKITNILTDITKEQINQIA